MTTKFVFSGSSYKKGEAPFQDMVRLFDVRNALVHLKPQEEFSKTSSGEIIRIKETKVIKLLPNNILAKFDEDVPADWKALISTQATAKWACNTVVYMVHSVLSMLPEGSFKKAAQDVFWSSFKSV